MGVGIAVYAGAQCGLEVGDSGAVDEVVEMLLRSALRLQGGFDGCFAEYSEGRVETGKGRVDVVEQLLVLGLHLSLNHVYAAADGFQSIHLLLHYVAYGCVLRSDDRVLFQEVTCRVYDFGGSP